MWFSASRMASRGSPGKAFRLGPKGQIGPVPYPWRMTEIVTYVEMTAPDQLSPAPAVPGLALERIDPGSSLVPHVIATIGAPYGWTRASWTEADWAEWLPDHSSRQFRLPRLDGAPAGMVCCEWYARRASRLTREIRPGQVE
jgi:hypothetical protein